MFFSSKKLLGLDIGSSSIKIAELSVGRSGATLENFGIIPTPLNSVISGDIADIGSVAGTVSSLLKELKVKRKSAVVGIWGTAVIIKKFSIPASEKKSLKEQISFYAEQYIPFDITNITLAFTFLKSSPDPASLDVLLIGAQNEVIGQYIQIANTAGLKCSVIDVTGFALANCYELNYGRSIQENVGILNFGASVTNFVALQKGELIFSRDIPVGGSNYSAEIHKTMGITPQEAESIKVAATVKRDTPEEVNTVIQTTNETVAEEIRNSLEFLGATSNNLSLSKIYYTGGSSVIPGMIDQVSKVTNIPVEGFNPFLRVKVNSKRINPAMQKQIRNYVAVAIGLGLREKGDS